MELDRADREPALVTEARTTQLKEKLFAAKAHIEKLQQIGEHLKAAPDHQLSLTDPDARSMATSGRGTEMVGYNVQMAVESDTHMIVAHEVTNVGHDHSALHAMASLARDAVGEDKLVAIADRGYYNGREIAACEEAGISTLLPKPLTSGNHAAGLFDKKDFRYLPDKDEYVCPARQRATKHATQVAGGQTVYRYWAPTCPSCSLKSR